MEEKKLERELKDLFTSEVKSMSPSDEWWNKVISLPSERESTPFLEKPGLWKFHSPLVAVSLSVFLVIIVLGVGLYTNIIKFPTAPKIPPSITSTGLPSTQVTTSEGGIVTTYSWAIQYASIGDLAKAADLVVQGKVAGIAESYLDKGIPFTNFYVDVTSVTKGSANSKILVTETGGAATNPGTVVIDGDPPLIAGKTYFLFLREVNPGRYVILGGPQGQFEVQKGGVFSLSVLYPDAHIFDLGVAGTPLADFTQQVKSSN